MSAYVAKTLHLIGHDLQFSFFSEACFKRCPEGLERHSALGLQDLVGQFLLLLLEIRGVWLLLFGYAIYEPVRSQVQRRTDLAWLELKGGGDLLTADRTGNRSISREKIAAL